VLLKILIVLLITYILRFVYQYLVSKSENNKKVVNKERWLQSTSRVSVRRDLTAGVLTATHFTPRTEAAVALFAVVRSTRRKEESGDDSSDKMERSANLAQEVFQLVQQERRGSLCSRRKSHRSVLVRDGSVVHPYRRRQTLDEIVGERWFSTSSSRSSFFSS